MVCEGQTVEVFQEKMAQIKMFGAATTVSGDHAAWTARAVAAACLAQKEQERETPFTPRISLRGHCGLKSLGEINPAWSLNANLCKGSLEIFVTEN